MKRPSILTGALFGGLLTLPLMALFGLGAAFSNLPFAPDFLFYFLRDVTPGNIVPSVIGVMGDIILALNIGRIDTVAKIVESTIVSWGGFFVFGVIVGAIFFAVLRALGRSVNAALPGVVLGLVLGVPFVLLYNRYAGQVVAEPFPSALWTIILSILYGLALSYVYYGLLLQSARAQATASASATAAPRAEAANAEASAEAIDRRQFLVRVGGAAAVVTVVGAGVSTLIASREGDVNSLDNTALNPDATPDAEVASLPNADDPVTPAPGTRPEVTALEDHYRIDIATVPPVIREEGYTLPFTTSLTADGAETTVRAFTLDEIKALPVTETYLTMSCISNRVAGDLISSIKWTGTSMQNILGAMTIPEGATHLNFTCADGFDEAVALDLINGDERIIMAYYWEDTPLPTEHGFPLRIHIPDHFGMKQPKWITSIEFINGDRDGYWVRRGWDKEARVRATSVIDTVATDMMIVEGDNRLIPVGGMAWAGARGLSRVEVRVDEGEWVEAQLRAPISDRTWQLWRYDWPFVEGDHLFEVRCVEADGTPQIERQAGVQPSGATGIHSERVMV